MYNRIVSNVDSYMTAVAYDIAGLNIINAHSVSTAAQRAG